MKDRKNLIYLAILSFVAFFSNLWIRPADLMEARNFITAREMFYKGNYIITTLNENLRFEKPPLPSWFTLLVMKLTGNTTNETILRVPVAIISIFFVFILYFLVKELTKNSRLSFFSAFVATTMFMLIKIGNENSWDMYTYVFSMGAILFLIKGFNSNKKSNYIFCAIFLTLSILSKGPVGIYGLFLPFIIVHMKIYGLKNYRENLKKLFLTLILTIILAGIWPLLVYIKYPEYFLTVLNKEKATWTTRHTESFIYYLDYFIYTGVWIFFSFIAWNKKFLEGCSEDKKYTKTLFFWNLLVLIFISIIKMKKKRYGLPLYMVSSFEIGLICEYYWNRSWENLKKLERVVLIIQGGFIALVGTVLSGFLFFYGYLGKKLTFSYTLFCLLIFSIFIYKGITFKRDKNIKILLIGSGIFMLCVNLTSNWFIDKNFYQRKVNNNYINLNTLRVKPPKWDIYSNDYEIEDVWRIGKSIKDLKDINKLPQKFIVFGEVPQEITDIYSLKREQTYSKDDGHLVELHYLVKKGDIK